jgi:hypothetical protein
VVRVLEDVVVEAGLHGRDRQLLAARSGAEEDGKVLVFPADVAEKVEGVDPARPVVREDDIEGALGQARRQLRRLGHLGDAALGKAVAQRLHDQGSVARVLVDDEEPQRFARTGPPSRASAGC